MTPAEFRGIRTALGLSAAKMGAALGGIDGRSIRRYESGERPILPTIALLMLLYRRSIDHPGLRKALDAASQEAAGSPAKGTGRDHRQPA